MRITLFQPDIPQNTGTILRLAACMGVDVDIIEPCGFVFSDAKFKRAGMDYIENMDIIRHENWAAFRQHYADRRLVLLTTKAETSFLDFKFQAQDILIFGQESAGAPDELHESVNERVLIPMQPGMRSLNIAVSAAMTMCEGLRQTGLFPKMG